MSAMQALLFHQWSEHMPLFPNGLDFPANQLEKARALGITIAPGTASGGEVADDHLTAALMEAGSRVELAAPAAPAATGARPDRPRRRVGRLAPLGVPVAAGTARGIAVAEDPLTAGLMEAGPRVELDALAVPATTRARLEGLESLGVDVTTNAMGIAVVADTAGHTSVPGVWAAGNVVNPGMQVIESAANGARVAMTINTETVFARSDRAVLDDHAQAGA